MQGFFDFDLMWKMEVWHSV